MAKNLVIVESPAKAKTIEGYLGKDYKVKSSFGHVRDLAKKGTAIDVENNFTPKYEVSQDKKQVVSDLKKEVKLAEVVWLATDEDREGEAISWHLYETLDLDNKITKRITFNEITKPAITKAIESPREINKELVDAQQARRILDRLVGFELSPVLWRKVRPSLSAGRVQSVAVRLIVEKEREIQKHAIETFYKVSAIFSTEKGKIRADVSRQIKSDQDVQELLQNCSTGNFKVSDVVMKPAVKKPAAPFTTSTLQQEASIKLGFSVSRTMTVAQRLYEAGRITYMRTDSVNLSDTAIKAAEAEIKKAYGAEFSNPKKYKTKDSVAQEAHEAIRPSDFSRHNIQGERDEERLYDLIWKRAIGSQMSDAKLERTTIKIGAANVSETFLAKGEVIKFEGFLKVYLESNLDEEDVEFESGLLPAVVKGDTVRREEIKATQRFSRPPARYVEASLVKKLESLGIGRPSTYAPTITTIQKRGYVEKPERDGFDRKYSQFLLAGDSIEKSQLSEVTGREKNKLAPTDIGIVVTDFLTEHFERIMDYNFTARVEEEFDEIAKGLVEWTEMIKDFYSPFHSSVEHTLENSERATGEREIGTHPESNRRIIARIGKFGPVVQIGDEQVDGEKAQFASLRIGQSINSITLEEALELFEFPKNIGVFEGEDIVVAVGRFGPYVKFKEMFVSIPKDEEIGSVDIVRAIELIKEKQAADAPVDEYEGLPVQKGTGRFGPFIKWNDMFINVNRKYDFDNLSHNDIVELIETKKQKEIDKMIHNWEDEGISVQKARWGRFNIVKGRTKIELPKTFDVDALTLEKVKEMLDANKPKKKAVKKKKKK
ncbi:MAG: type I DNA topoisomerase [Crocinitomicaceae bacterium]|jgi:DNA topoisomerase-1|nr:type I DNA topoisomerase [Crocinitomicaceae bacterium]